jgi:hypothetical protein
MGELLGVDSKAAKRAIRMLSVPDLKHIDKDGRPIGRGHLRIIQGGGRHRANEYEMILKTGAPVTRFDNRNRGAGNPVSTVERGANGARNGGTSDPPTIKKIPSESNYMRAPARETHGGITAAINRRPAYLDGTGGGDSGRAVGDQERLVPVELVPGSSEFAACMIHLEKIGAKFRLAQMEACADGGRSFYIDERILADALAADPPALRVMAGEGAA